MARSLALVALLAGALLANASCGGGSDSRDPSLDQTMTAPPVAGKDGFVVHNGSVGTPYVSNPATVAVGDWWWPGPVPPASENVARGFVTFDISTLPPPPAVVREATLSLYQLSPVGTPLPKHGNVLVELVSIGAALDGTDWNLGPLAVDSVAWNPIFSSDIATGYKTLDVRGAVGNRQVAGSSEITFRLRFSGIGAPPIADNSTSDYFSFMDAEDTGTTGFVPVLTIRYTP